MYTYANDSICGERYIEWHENIKLTWDDFQGDQPEKISYELAAAATSVKMSFDINEARCEITCCIKVLFNKKKSWTAYKPVKIMNDSLGAEYLLKHEQGHFDIKEIYARMIRKKLSKIKRSSFKEVKREIENVKREFYSLESKDKYDKETNHSMNKEQQAIWDKKIFKELNDLDKYKNNTVIIKYRCD